MLRPLRALRHWRPEITEPPTPPSIRLSSVYSFGPAGELTWASQAAIGAPGTAPNVESCSARLPSAGDLLCGAMADI